METSEIHLALAGHHYPLYMKSGLSRKDYCEQAGIGFSFFVHWSKKYLAAQAELGSFNQISPEQPAGDSIEINYADGTQIVLPGHFPAEYIRGLL